MSASPRETTRWLALLALAPLLAACTEFTPRDRDVDAHDAEVADALDASGDVPVEDADVPPDGGDADTGEDVDAAGDADALDVTPDEVGPGDVDADAPACEDACPAVDETRCAPDAEATVERCVVDPDSGCRVWEADPPCPSDDLCLGPATCEDGACAHDPAEAVECPQPAAACTVSVCVPATGACEDQPAPQGTECTHPDPCIGAETCDETGACVGFASSIECPCSETADCLQFDDGDLCNGHHVCQGETCVFSEATAVSCGVHPEPCLSYACNPATGSCDEEALEDGTACDDGDACSGASSCAAGECLGSDFVTCEAGECEVASCDPGTGQCVTEPLPVCCGNSVPEGPEQCDDGNEITGDGCEPGCTLTSCRARGLAFGEGCLLVPGEGLLTTTGALTLDFFIRPDPASAEVVLFDRERNTQPGVPDWHMRLSPSEGGPVLTWVEGRVSLPDLEVPGPTLTTGQWQHVALTRDPGTKTIAWWRNGLPEGGLTGEPMDDLGSSEELWIGCSGGLPGFFEGALDEVRLSPVVRWSSNFPPPSFPHFIDDDTAALWHFDHVRPGVAVDAASQGHDAFWQGTSATQSQPFPGSSGSCAADWCGRSALEFDPAAENVGLVATPTALDGAQTLAVEFFLRADVVDMTSDQVVLSRSSTQPGAADWHIVLRTGAANMGRLVWIEGQLGGGDNPLSSPSSIVAGQWHHVAVVRDFSDPGSPTIRWFIDGVPGTPKVLSGALPLSGNEPLSLGSQAGASGFFDGAIDELRISGAVLYEGGFEVPGTLSPRSDTLGLYHFDVGRGTWAYPDAPGPLAPLELEGVGWLPNGAPAVAPCP